MAPTLLLGFPDESVPNDAHDIPTESYIGGYPTFYDMEPPLLECCGEEMFLLMKLYAPIDEEHRMVHLFSCANEQCNRVRALRNRLRKQAKPQATSSPRKQIDWTFDSSKSLSSLVDELSAELTSKVSVKETKQQRSVFDNAKLSVRRTKQALPAFYVAADTEVEPKHDYAHEMRLYEEYQKNQSHAKETQADEWAEESYEKQETLTKLANKFHARVSWSPEQILRYDLGGSPLLYSELKEEIGTCCKQKLRFEFQLMPALLSFYSKNELLNEKTWMTALVYSCVNDCAEELTVVINE